MYTPTLEDGIHTCRTEVQDRQAFLLRTNEVQIHRMNSLGSDGFLRKEIREGFLKEMACEIGPEEWGNFHWLGIRTSGTNGPVVWLY